MNTDKHLGHWIVIFSLACISIWGWAYPKTIEYDSVRAKHFEVIGENGKVRAEISTGNGEMPLIRLLDDNGTERAVLKLSASGSPELQLNDANKSAMTVLKVDDNSSGLAIHGTDRNTPSGVVSRDITLHVYKSRQARIAVSDNRAHSNHVASISTRFSAGVASGGDSYLSVSGDQSPSRFNIKAPPRGNISTAVYNSENKRIWSVPQSK